MGTPDFSVAALEALINDGHEIVAVYTQPPRPAGRGQKEQKSPVHLAAEKHNIAVRTPKSLKNQEEQQIFKNTNADMAVVVAYGLILPKPILEACPCINIHASMLPRWRGAAPIQRAILAGDSSSGVTIMQMDEGLDTGDMLIWQEVDITPTTTAGILHDELSKLGAELIVKYVNNKDKITPIKQEGEATYASKISKDEAKIDFNCDIITVDRQIRAFAPFMGAFFTLHNEKFKVFSAIFKQLKHQYKCGEIIDDRFGIALSDGILYPQIIQRQGKKNMTIDELLRGYKVMLGVLCFSC
jgi:methionyl-tRNA formyltransferase